MYDQDQAEHRWQDWW